MESDDRLAKRPWMLKLAAIAVIVAALSLLERKT